MSNQTNNSRLVVDIGNSSLKWAVSNSNGLTDMLSQQYKKNISSAFFIECWKGLMPDEVVVSCVAGDLVWQSLEQACNELWNVKAQRVNSLKEGFGLVNAYDDFPLLGSDRWCAMIGALHNTDSAFMVIDAGSALTLDVVDKCGVHLGGYIVPGISMMEKSLGLHTAQIHPKGSGKNSPSLALGKSTKDCVEAGIYLSAVKLIEAVYTKEAKQMGKCQVFITGGDAKQLVSLLSFKCVIMKDLVLLGLDVIAANN